MQSNLYVHINREEKYLMFYKISKKYKHKYQFSFSQVQKSFKMRFSFNHESSSFEEILFSGNYLSIYEIWHAPI